MSGRRAELWMLSCIQYPHGNWWVGGVTIFGILRDGFNLGRGDGGRTSASKLGAFSVSRLAIWFAWFIAGAVEKVHFTCGNGDNKSTRERDPGINWDNTLGTERTDGNFGKDFGQRGMASFLAFIICYLYPSKRYELILMFIFSISCRFVVCVPCALCPAVSDS